MAWSLQTAIHTLDHADIILSQDDAEHVREFLNSFLVHWQGMFQTYDQVGVRRWKCRPKHHYFQELIAQVYRTRINPKYFACWQDESYLGHIKKVATHCHAGNALLRVLQRLVVNLGRRFEQTRQTARQAELLGCPKKVTNPSVNQLPLKPGS